MASTRLFLAVMAFFITMVVKTYLFNSSVSMFKAFFAWEIPTVHAGPKN